MLSFCFTFTLLTLYKSNTNDLRYQIFLQLFLKYFHYSISFDLRL